MSKFKQGIFLSLPVSDLAKSVAFYQAIGLSQNRQFSDETAVCMVLSETISIMLITHPKWKEFTTRTIPDARKTAQFGLTITRESKSAVDATVERGAKVGGKPDPNPIEEYPFMYGRSLEDPDGHIVEPKWIDMSVMHSA